MEKWRSKGKSSSKEESVLPPTRRPSVQNCLPIDKKKDRKWSFGGLLRRISSGQHNNDVSSNEEDITYIPGHMLAKKQIKKTSKMKSKLGKFPREASREEKTASAEEIYDNTGKKNTAESIGSTTYNADKSQDSTCGACNDSINSPSSEGSLDALGKNSRINRMKARARAKRDLMYGNSSSEDDSHRSSQSSVRFRSDDSIQNVQRTDSWSRRTRGARTERYVKRISRDDLNSGSDTKLRKSTNSPSNQTILEYFSNVPDLKNRRATDNTTITSPSGSSSGILRSNEFFDDKTNNSLSSNRRYVPRSTDRLIQDDTKFYNRTETRYCDKFTWPKTNFRRTNPANEIYGSLRPRQFIVENLEKNEKMLPPEPPPRSSKSRIFANACNTKFLLKNPSTQQSYRRYYQPGDTTNIRSYNSDNEIFHSDYWPEMVNARLPSESGSLYANEHYKNIDHSYEQTSPNVRSKGDCNDKQKYHEDSYCFENLISSSNRPRTTTSLPKGVELFSRQKLANCANYEEDYNVPESPKFNETKLIESPVPRPRVSRETSQSPASKKILDDNEAERRRSSKNLQEALFELEAIYNSLRLSDPDLLDRAEQRTMDEYRDKAAKSAAEHSLKSCSDASSTENHEFFHPGSTQSDANLRFRDDMAYRRMNPKERPSSVNGQSSLSQISYLATSPNLSIRENDCMKNRSRRSTPDLTRDDLLFRSISHSINTLKVIEPQPPFGIPLGPVTGAMESDYLHVKPKATKYGHTRSLYIPKSEPDVINDDLAYRNLRKDKDHCSGINRNTNVYLQTDSVIEQPLTTRYKTWSSLDTRNKRSVGLNSTNICIRDTDWYDNYAKTTQKLILKPDVENVNNSNFMNDAKESFDEMRDFFDHRNKADLDINGNRPKSALQQKIQVHVPHEISASDDEKHFSNLVPKHSRNSHDSRKLTIDAIVTESEDSLPERCCDSRNSSLSDVQPDNDENNIEEKISEYMQLCQDLEKLIQQTADDETTVKHDGKEQNITREENNSQSEFDDWEKMLNDDYEIPPSILNFGDNLKFPSNERYDDRSLSRSMGLSNENLTLSKKINDKFCEDDLLSSASELGNSSNNGSLNDSVYDKFNELLKDINYIPLVECTNKIGKYPTDEFFTMKRNLGDSFAEHKPVGVDCINDNKELRNTEEKSPEFLDNASHVLEYRTKVVLPNKHSEDQYLTKNLQQLKSLAGENEEANNEICVVTTEKKSRSGRKNDKDYDTFDHRKVEKDDENVGNNEEYDLNKTTMYEKCLSPYSENVLPVSRQNIDKFVDDDLLASTSESGICSTNESFNDSVYDKFNELIREVDDIPQIERMNKIDKYPVNELATTVTEDLMHDIEDDEELRKIEEESLRILDKASNLQKYRTKVVLSPNEHLKDQYLTKNLQHLKSLTRRVRNEETNNDDTMNEGKTRPGNKKDDNDDNIETFAYREGEKNVEDELACYDDDAYAFKDSSMHKFRKLCHLTNSITICDIVLCSFFLTLLITIVFA